MYAIIGNIIDFNPIHELTGEMIEKQFEQLRTEELEINDCESLLQDIKCAKSLLYVGDNCGEISSAIEVIKKEFKSDWSGCTLTEIYYAGDDTSKDWADRNDATVS